MYANALVNELLRWEEVQVDEVSEIREWLEAGCTPADAADWTDNRHPNTYLPPLTASEAQECVRNGLTAGVARRWVQAVSLTDALMWHQHGYTVADLEALQYDRDGPRGRVDPEWAERRLPVDYIEACLDAGLLPAEAGEPWSIDRDVLDYLIASHKSADTRLDPWDPRR